MNNLSPFCHGSTTRPPENSAATKALNRAEQAVGLLAALDCADFLYRVGVAVIARIATLNRFDLLDNLVEEIQRWQARRDNQEWR